MIAYIPSLPGNIFNRLTHYKNSGLWFLRSLVISFFWPLKKSLKRARKTEIIRTCWLSQESDCTLKIFKLSHLSRLTEFYKLRAIWNGIGIIRFDKFWVLIRSAFVESQRAFRGFIEFFSSCTTFRFLKNLWLPWPVTVVCLSESDSMSNTYKYPIICFVDINHMSSSILHIREVGFKFIFIIP